MQAQLADAYSQVYETYQQASDVLGYDLWALVQDGPDTRLNETVVTQPAMLTAGVAAWRCWQSAGGATPTFVAGHSLGEYSALVMSGALRFEQAVSMVRRRAELMQEAVPAGSGAMAAILGLDDAAIVRVCADVAEGEVVDAVNFNAPGQVVIAGNVNAVQRAIEAAKIAGARRAMMLSVSVPSHCALMRPAAEVLAVELRATDIRTPDIAVVSNVDVAVYADADAIRSGLTRQLFSPVRWVETIQYLTSNGATAAVESGPGKVLTGLNKRIDRALATTCIDSAESIDKALA